MEFAYTHQYKIMVKRQKPLLDNHRDHSVESSSLNRNPIVFGQIRKLAMRRLRDYYDRVRDLIEPFPGSPCDPRFRNVTVMYTVFCAFGNDSARLFPV